MKKQSGIMWFFSSLGAAVLLMAVAVIGTMVYGVSVQSQLQEQFIARTSAVDTILADLYEMETVFGLFSRDWSEEGFATYQQACEKLTGDLEDYREYCKEAPVTLNYIRRLNSFNVYQQNQIRKALDGEEAQYATVRYVDGGLNMHQQQALEMAKNDMLYARNRYEADFEKVSRWMFFISGAFAIAALVMGVLLARFSIVTKRVLDGMMESFNHLAARDWDVPDLKDSRYREFTLISQTANHMKQEIKNYIKEIEKQAKLEKQLNEERLLNEQQHTMVITAQMSALRAQVNPHFLFNSLNLIGVTALVGNSEHVMQLVEATGNILRYSLYQKELTTPLEEELDIVSQYLFLQKCRFGEAVKAEIHNDLDGEDIFIPTMSIQPVVENCFKHGFGNKENLHIHISVTKEEENLVAVCVADDGVGFDVTQVQSEGDSGIGLNNIRKRLELMYGAGRQWMEIESEPGVFSSVTILIPQKGGVQ
ncbi:MAG: histidine kinase [Hungatella hathewayi]|nr:histidine kinase [Hungatella hathewayi]